MEKTPGMYWDGGLEGIPPNLRETPPTLRDCCFPYICPLKTIKFHKTPISPGMELVWLLRAVYKAQFSQFPPVWTQNTKRWKSGSIIGGAGPDCGSADAHPWKTGKRWERQRGKGGEGKGGKGKEDKGMGKGKK